MVIVAASERNILIFTGRARSHRERAGGGGAARPGPAVTGVGGRPRPQPGPGAGRARGGYVAGPRRPRYRAAWPARGGR